MLALMQSKIAAQCMLLAHIISEQVQVLQLLHPGADAIHKINDVFRTKSSTLSLVHVAKTKETYECIQQIQHTQKQQSSTGLWTHGKVTLRQPYKG